MRFLLISLGCLLQGFVCSEVQRIGPGRDWLERTYLPCLEGRILYVGVGSYTTQYPFLTKTPWLFETIDFAQDKAQFGSPFVHHTADFMMFQPNYKFDHICLFGVMGHPQDAKTSIYSILSDEEILQALEHADRLLQVGGTLQLGPNHIAVAEQNAQFWINKLSLKFFHKYETLFVAIGTDNVVWWGRKYED